MPTYDRAALIVETIQSVRRQTHSSWELIVVDDGSTDDTSEVLARIGDPRIVVLRLPHSGSLPKVRNAGLKTAKGRYIALLDSDDLWRPDKLERQVTLLESDPDIRYAFSSGGQFGIDAVDIPTYDTEIGNLFGPLVFEQKYALIPSSLIFEAAVMGEIGRLNEDWGGVCDADLFYRLAHRYTGAYIGEKLVSVRKHSDNHSRGYEHSLTEMLDLYRSYAADNRLTGAQADILISRTYRRMCALQKEILQNQPLSLALPLLRRCVEYLLRSEFHRARAVLRA